MKWPPFLLTISKFSTLRITIPSARIHSWSMDGGKNIWKNYRCTSITMEPQIMRDLSKCRRKKKGASTDSKTPTLSLPSLSPNKHNNHFTTGSTLALHCQTNCLQLHHKKLLFTRKGKQHKQSRETLVSDQERRNRIVAARRLLNCEHAVQTHSTCAKPAITQNLKKSPRYTRRVGGKPKQNC